MNYLEICCLVFCFLHFLFEIIVSFIQGRKIKRLCDKCGFPVYENVDHNCQLSESQLSKLVDFISDIKGVSNVSSK